MTQNIVATLADIGNKPGTTHRDALTITRRVLRITCLQYDSITAERRALRRQAGKLRQFLPFTAQRVTDLERQAREHLAEQLEGTRQVLVAFGTVLLRDPDDIAGALGFDRLADMLSINPTHREQARQDGGESLAGLVSAARAEDSATHHGTTWGAGGPLYRACQAALLEFIRSCPDEELPNPFAPGAPFGPRLPPDLRLVPGGAGATPLQ